MFVTGARRSPIRRRQKTVHDIEVEPLRIGRDDVTVTPPLPLRMRRGHGRTVPDGIAYVTDERAHGIVSPSEYINTSPTARRLPSFNNRACPITSHGAGLRRKSMSRCDVTDNGTRP